MVAREDAPKEFLMSYSSATEMHSCKRKYFFHKIAKIPVDDDCEEDLLAFRIGLAYHAILENTLHDKANLTDKIFQDACSSQNLDIEDKYRVYAMVMKYYQLRKASKLSIITCEIQVKNSKVVGYVDAILTDAFGNWWILDLKTTSRINKLLVSRLNRDTQLNLYAAFKDLIAERLDLDPTKFAGVRYNAAQKPTAKFKASENLEAYRVRTSGSVEVYEFAVKAEDLDPEAALADIEECYDTAIELQQETDPKKVPCSYSGCESYFRACSYWSQCYGVNHSVGGIVEFHSAETMTDQTLLF